MPSWICPECGRRFGRSHQGHECAPALSIEEYFTTGPPHERPVFEAVWAHLSTLADDDGEGVYLEPVSVGIFFKRRTTFAQLRPMTRWVALTFGLRRRLTTDRLSRKVMVTGSRYHHVVNLTDPSEVDDVVRGWLTEAFLDDG
jgi:Domain of unknown function (DUF5655)